MIKFKKDLTARKMRIILVAALILFIVLIFAVIYFGSKILSENSESLTESITNSESTENLLNQIKTAKSKLEEQKNTVKKAEKIVASSKNYKYQDEFLRDINKYASICDLEINSYSFEVPNSLSGQSTGGISSTLNTASSSTNSSNVSNKVIAPPGTEITNATISIKGSVKYDSFLKFLKLIENNVVRMRIQDLSLSAQKTESGETQISVPSITMEIYIKK